MKAFIEWPVVLLISAGVHLAGLSAATLIVAAKSGPGPVEFEVSTEDFAFDSQQAVAATESEVLRPAVPEVVAASADSPVVEAQSDDPSVSAVDPEQVLAAVEGNDAESPPALPAATVEDAAVAVNVAPVTTPDVLSNSGPEPPVQTEAGVIVPQSEQAERLPDASPGLLSPEGSAAVQPLQDTDAGSAVIPDQAEAGATVPETERAEVPPDEPAGTEAVTDPIQAVPGSAVESPAGDSAPPVNTDAVEADVAGEVGTNESTIVESVPAEPIKEEPQPEQTALLTPIKPAKPDRTEEIKGFFNGYDGGDCFLTIPTAIEAGRANVIGYGAAEDSFNQLVNAFRTSVDAELVVNRKQISRVQCSAIELLKAFAVARSQPLTLEIENANIADGANLSATLTHANQSIVKVLLVDDEGMVNDVSGFLSREGRVRRLAVPVHVRGEGRDKIQILIAISSSKELSMLDIPEATALDSMLPMMMGQIRLSGGNAQAAIASFQVR